MRGGGCALGAAGAGSVLAQGRNKKASGSQDGFHIKQRIFRHATCLRSPEAQDYVSLRLRSGMGEKNLERSRIALNNSLFTVSIYEDEKLIGFGRVVGDGAITFAVSDIMVDREYQRRGYAERIMLAIDRFFDENAYEDSYILLIANHPADLLYRKHRFEYLPENKCGMLRDQREED